MRRISYVTTYNDDEAFEEIGARVNLLENNFAVAFGIDHWQDGIRNDPRYVKWIAVEHMRQDGQHHRIAHQLHACTEKDFDRFYPPSRDIAEEIIRWKDAKGLFCFDLEQHNIELYGTWRKAMDYKALDFMAVPCITSFEGEQDQTDDVREDCVTDK